MGGCGTRAGIRAVRPITRTASVGLLAFCLWMLTPADAGAADLQIVYNPAAAREADDARVFIEDEGITQTVSALINENFNLRSPLTLVMGSNRGPAFEEAADEIHMPYEFVFDIAERFNSDSLSGSGADIYEVTRDAYLHALMHQISHALFAMYDLRTSGNTEKAVDALAILLLIRYYENGGDIVMHAAELFVDESGSGAGTRSGSDFWTIHELDRQSYNQALCLVYGSDPQRYGNLRARSEFLQIRDQECAREYQRQVSAWFRVLGSFLKRSPPG